MCVGMRSQLTAPVRESSQSTHTPTLNTHAVHSNRKANYIQYACHSSTVSCPAYYIMQPRGYDLPGLHLPVPTTVLAERSGRGCVFMNASTRGYRTKTACRISHASARCRGVPTIVTWLIGACPFSCCYSTKNNTSNERNGSHKNVGRSTLLRQLIDILVVSVSKSRS